MEEEILDKEEVARAFEESKSWDKVRPKNKTKLGNIPDE